MIEPFVPSGRVSPRFALTGPAMLAISVVLGGGMGAFAASMPTDGPKKIVALGVGLLFLCVLHSAALSFALQLGHVRSPRIGKAAAVVAGLTASGASVAAMAWTARELGGDSAFESSLLVLVAIAAVPVVGIGWVVATRAAGAPYCEDCGRWSGRFVPVIHLSRSTERAIRGWIRGWEIDKMLTAPLATDADDEVDVIEASRCPSCADFAAIRHLQVDYRGRGSRDVALRLPAHVVPGPDVDLLTDLAREAERRGPAAQVPPE